MSNDAGYDEGPAALIRASGKTLKQIANEAGVSLDLVYRCKARDYWPSQQRTRTGLRRALGLPEQIPQPTADTIPQAVG